MSYSPVMLQRLDTETETWADVRKLHAVKINRKAGAETFDAGAGQYHLSLVFRFAWSRVIEQLRYDPQHYQLVYQGHAFNITGYDDYMESHIYADITGVCYG